MSAGFKSCVHFGDITISTLKVGMNSFIWVQLLCIVCPSHGSAPRAWGQLWGEKWEWRGRGVGRKRDGKKRARGNTVYFRHHTNSVPVLSSLPLFYPPPPPLPPICSSPSFHSAPRVPRMTWEVIIVFLWDLAWGLDLGHIPDPCLRPPPPPGKLHAKSIKTYLLSDCVSHYSNTLFSTDF